MKYTVGFFSYIIRFIWGMIVSIVYTIILLVKVILHFLWCFKLPKMEYEFYNQWFSLTPTIFDGNISPFAKFKGHIGNHYFKSYYHYIWGIPKQKPL